MWPLLTEEGVAELQMVVSCNMDTGNSTQVLWKTIQCPSALSCLSQGFPWEIPGSLDYSSNSAENNSLKNGTAGCISNSLLLIRKLPSILAKAASIVLIWVR